MLYGKGAVPDAASDPNLKKLFDIGVAGLTLMVPFSPPTSATPFLTAPRWPLRHRRLGGQQFWRRVLRRADRRHDWRPGGLLPEKIPVHKVLRSVMPIFIIPIVGTFITAGIMMWGLGEPVGALTANLTGWLQGMREGSIVVLAIIMGLMLAFDMGGPVNKVAYAFMLICVSQGVYSVVAIAAVGIAVPPLGMGLATLIGRKYFTAEERETGKAALVMGCVGVTEGAIPFAAADPLRVIPATCDWRRQRLRHRRADGRPVLRRLGRGLSCCRWSRASFRVLLPRCWSAPRQRCLRHPAESLRQKETH